MQRGSHKFDQLMEFSPIYTIINYYYIMLRVHKKRSKIQFYHVTDKTENSQRIKKKGVVKIVSSNVMHTQQLLFKSKAF
jgi:hypothetical protein